MSDLNNALLSDLKVTQRVRAVISFDIDGTLLNEQDRMHPADADLIRNGIPEILFVPNTGRPFHSVKELLSQYQLFVNQPFPLPSVNLNGSAVYGPGETLLDMAHFDPETQSQMIEIAHSADPAVSILFQDAFYDYVLRSNAFGEQAIARYLFKTRPLPADHQQYNFGKVMFISKNPQTLLAIHQACEKITVDISSSMSTILEIAPAGVNKGSGVQRLLVRLGLEGLPVYAAGDGGNDIDFLTSAKRAFVPATSPANIQALADVIIDTQAEGLLTPILRQI